MLAFALPASVVLPLALGLIALAIYAIIRQIDVRLVLFVTALALGGLAESVDVILRKFLATFSDEKFVIPICTAMGFSYVLRRTGCDLHLVRLLVPAAAPGPIPADPRHYPDRLPREHAGRQPDEHGCFDRPGHNSYPAGRPSGGAGHRRRDPCSAVRSAASYSIRALPNCGPPSSRARRRPMSSAFQATSTPPSIA